MTSKVNNPESSDQRSSILEEKEKEKIRIMQI